MSNFGLPGSSDKIRSTSAVDSLAGSREKALIPSQNGIELFIAYLTYSIACIFTSRWNLRYLCIMHEILQYLLAWKANSS